MKRILGVLVAVAALGGATASVRSIDADRVAAARGEVERAAAGARQKAADDLQLRLRSIEGRAASAATVQQLVAILAQLRQGPLEGQLADTLENWFRMEPHWKPFRSEVAVYAVSADATHLGLIVGAKAAEFASDGLLKATRDRGLASDIVRGYGALYTAAAARVPVPGLQAPPLVLLANRLDGAALNEIAQRTGGAVAVSDGKALLVASGAGEDIDNLATQIGRESPNLPFSETTGAWAAAAVPIGPGLWLWAHARAAGPSSATTRGVSGPKGIIWGAALLIAALALMVAFRRTTPLAQAQTPTAQVAADEAIANPTTAPPDLIAGAPPRTTGTRDRPVGFAATMHAVGAATANVFGRYTLVELLGEGGMSQVYTAVIFGAEGFRRKFVVKRLRPELLRDPDVVAQFIDEANLASSLIHSNIVPVLDFGKVGNEYFMATEYILGRDLGRLTRQSVERLSRPLSVEVVLAVAHDTLTALQYAHTKTGEGGKALAIVHRDVSPANILITARGEVKLFDFGIVKAEGRVTRTQQGVVKGNVSFMSPEQAKGGETDGRSDLFSMGLVMYYALTGKVLYEGNTTFELLVKAAGGPGPTELRAIGALPPVVASLLARALAVEPTARFATAAEFAAAIAPHIARHGNALAELVDSLFHDDFQAEESRFSAAIPAGARQSPTVGRLNEPRNGSGQP